MLISYATLIVDNNKGHKKMTLEQMTLKNLINEAMAKRGKYRVCRIISNSDISLWCETPGYNWEREFRFEATIMNIDGKSTEWKHTIKLTKNDQYSDPGTIEEIKAFEKAILDKVSLSAS